MATKQDYYTMLGVAREASAEDLKRAYRKLAMQHHPDRNPGDAKAEAKFKELNEAYDVLKDDQKRAAYDRFGHAAFANGGPQGGGPGGAGFGGFAGGFNFGDAGGLGDIFDQMFGEALGRRGGGRSRTGADLSTGVEISLEEAFSGEKKTIRVATRVQCDSCHGTGSDSGKASDTTCPTCGGAGRVRAQRGLLLVEQTCPTCSGTGRVVRNPCKVCGGAGTVERERSLQVAIPAGVEDGTRIRLAGEGAAGRQGAPAGDLYVHIAVRPHEIFQRDGAHIYCRVPLPMAQAALGGEIEVPAIDGSRAKVKIPPGTQTGDQFRLRAKGFSVLRSAARGDMYIQVSVETPQNLTRRQRELLEEFDAESKKNESGSPETEGFFAKVAQFFEGKS
jgi:molecular chaperone DnaJ